MKPNKLLEKQIKKFFPGGVNGNDDFARFINAVNDSYNSYERDRELANHAFAISEAEYIEVNNELKSEIDRRNISISKLKKAIAQMAGSGIGQSSDDLLDIVAYLESQITERKRTEEELKRLSLVASANKNGVVLTNSDGTIFWCNEGFSVMTGFSPEQTIGKTPVELLRGEMTDKKPLREMIELFASGKNFDVELICYRRDRSRFWGRATGQSILNDGGSVLHYFAVVEDITHEKEAQQKLAEFESRFRTALEKIGDNVWEYDCVTNNFYFSNKANHLHAFGREEFIENVNHWRRQIHPDDKVLLLQNDARYKENKIDHHNLEYRLLATDGTTRWILDRGIVIERDSDHKPVRIIGTHTDITERKISEQALRLNEEKYRNIIANMNLGLMEVDNDENVQYANQCFCEMSGYGLDEIIGKKASSLFVREQSLELMETRNEMRKKGLSDSYEVAVKNKRGELKWWLISGAPRYNDTGRLVGSIGIHLDITAKKKLEIELYDARETAEQSARAKEQFLANMSHEIRTPMNAILGMGRQLDKTELSGQQQFFLDTINKAAQHLLVVINDILDISKVEAGKLNLERIGFRPDEVIKHCVQTMSHRAEEKGLRLIKCTSDGTYPVFIGDPHRLTQVLLNLISNAVKFTEKGSVSVDCKLSPENSDQQTLTISVKDTGIGMEKEFLGNLFQKFTQEDKTTARKYGGTGLGMSISKQLVELMHGTIDVRSRKGEGTEVTIAIPFTVGTPADLPEDHKSSADSTDLRGKKILLVEDNDMNRLVATTVLKQYDTIVCEVENGEEAINELKRTIYDLVLMDVQMPVMDGLQATAVIRSEISKTIPIIALTANAIKGESDRCLEVGMNDFVSKPFEEEDLVTTMAKWLDQPVVKETPKPLQRKPVRNDKLYDLSKLYKIGNGKKDFVMRMTNLFIEQAPGSVRDIRDALTNKQYQRLNAAAHKLKPSLDSMGIVSLFKVIRDIELLAVKEPLSEDLPGLIEILEAEIAEALDQLKANEELI